MFICIFSNSEWRKRSISSDEGTATSATTSSGATKKSVIADENDFSTGNKAAATAVSSVKPRPSIEDNRVQKVQTVVKSTGVDKGYSSLNTAVNSTSNKPDKVSVSLQSTQRGGVEAPHSSLSLQQPTKPIQKQQQQQQLQLQPRSMQVNKDMQQRTLQLQAKIKQDLEKKQRESLMQKMNLAPNGRLSASFLWVVMIYWLLKCLFQILARH